MRQSIEDFLKSKKIVLVGYSENKKKFGNYIFKELNLRGFEVAVVSKSIDSIEGNECYKNLELAKNISESLLICTKPEQTKLLLEEAIQNNFKYIWLQQGAENGEIIEFIKKNNIKAVYGKCILMYAEPVKSFHRFHRGINKLMKTY